MMKTSLAVVAALSLGSAQANSSKEEAVGVGTGAIIGGVIGGPVGFMIGTASGAILGDKFNQRKVRAEQFALQLEQREAELSQRNQDNTQLRSQLAHTQSSLSEVQKKYDPQMERMLSLGLAMDLPFRTNETQVQGSLAQRLHALGEVLAESDDIMVQIDGFADPRGSVEYNAKLSLQRAESIREILAAAGVSSARIATYGHGERADSEALLPSVDELALERRVTLTLYRVEDADVGIASRH